MTIRLGDKQCTFVAGGFELTTKLIEGTYPNYRQVVPASFARTVEVPTSVFLAKIETVSLVLSDSSSYIILRFENNQLNLQASSAEVGEGSDMVEIAFEGEPFEVSFNPAYLADPLRNAGCGQDPHEDQRPAEPGRDRGQRRLPVRDHADPQEVSASETCGSDRTTGTGEFPQLCGPAGSGFLLPGWCSPARTGRERPIFWKASIS